jgi:tryptophan-rich sensory protein
VNAAHNKEHRDDVRQRHLPQHREPRRPDHLDRRDRHLGQDTASRRRVHWSHLARAGLATILAAVCANTVFYYLAQAFVSYDSTFVVLANPGGTIIMTLAPAVVAVLMYAALVRFTRRPERIFDVIAALVFVVTLVPDFTYIPTVPGSSNPQTAVLVAMHVIAAVVIVGNLTRQPFTR